MPRLKIVVLVSGGGSNFQAILDAIQGQNLEAEVVGLISNRREAFALERARKFGVESFYIGKGNYPDIQDRDQALLQTLEALAPDLIILAGYLAILPPEVIARFKRRIINIHPSLIPNHCGPGYYGIKVHESVILSGDAMSGATTHFVDEGVDTGEVIFQETVALSEDETPLTLSNKVLSIEHKLLVYTLKAIISGDVRLGA